MLMGWGLFNFVEGVIDHHVLHVHHVVESLGVSIWDWVFLGSGVVLAGAGWSLIRSGRTSRPAGRVAPAHGIS
jgi:uncharacterized membrane protein